MRHLRRPGEIELREGTRLLDRYSILDRIGSGGMATIYRATDERLDRVVCVKLLRTTIVEGGGTTGSQAVYKATYSHFLQEAVALSKLSHSNTLRIYDFGYLRDASGDDDKSAPFHVSEYLDGGNLESHVRMRGPLSGQEAVGILDSICDAVAEAHEAGIIHRDIKPSNILFARIREELVPKLADFGIANSDVKKNDGGAGDFSESVSTVALFSPRWAAPEQLCGSPEGPHTDVYALGLLTIFMLAGEVLFDDDDVRETFNDRVRGDTLVQARVTKLRLPVDVNHVLRQALLARPDDRIETAPEFARRMREALKVKTSTSVVPLAVDGAPRVERIPPAPLPDIGGPPPSSPRRAPSSPGFAPSVSLPQVVLELATPDLGAGPPRERLVVEGSQRIRFVQVLEKLDVSFVDGEQTTRVRVTMLPGQGMSLNVKGLTCFVARQRGRPSSAVTLSEDATVELVSSARQTLGEIFVSFGQATPSGRLFLVDRRQVLVAYGEAQKAVALTMNRSSDIIVMCRS